MARARKTRICRAGSPGMTKKQPIKAKGRAKIECSIFTIWHSKRKRFHTDMGIPQRHGADRAGPPGRFIHQGVASSEPPDPARPGYRPAGARPVSPARIPTMVLRRAGGANSAIAEDERSAYADAFFPRLRRRLQPPAQPEGRVFSWPGKKEWCLFPWKWLHAAGLPQRGLPNPA